MRRISRTRLRLAFLAFLGRTLSVEEMEVLGIDPTLRAYPTQLQEAVINVIVEEIDRE